MEKLRMWLKCFIFGLTTYCVDPALYALARLGVQFPNRERFNARDTNVLLVTVLERLLKERKLRRVLPTGKQFAIEVLLDGNRNDLWVAVFDLEVNHANTAFTGLPKTKLHRAAIGPLHYVYANGQVKVVPDGEHTPSYFSETPILVYKPTWWTPELEIDIVAALTSPLLNQSAT